VSEGEEFVTIAEAARQLGISERQTRRDAGRLSGDDRRVFDTGPMLVRLAALARLRGIGLPDGNSTEPLSGDVRQVADNDRLVSGNGGQVADTATDDRQALIEQLRAENERLNAALERAQGALQQALGALANEQGRTAQLEHLQTRLIEALPRPLEMAPEVPGDAQTGGRPAEAPEVQAPAGGLQEAPGVAQEGRTGPWWAFWRRSQREEK